jgi:rubrerythrin
MSERRDSGDPADGPYAAPEDSGGDPVCWLNRVCPECGTFIEGKSPTHCPRCAEALPSD